MFPYSQYAIYNKGYHEMFLLTICNLFYTITIKYKGYLNILYINTKDTMVTYFIPSLEMFPYSQYAIQRIPW